MVARSFSRWKLHLYDIIWSRAQDYWLKLAVNLWNNCLDGLQSVFTDFFSDWINIYGLTQILFEFMWYDWKDWDQKEKRAKKWGPCVVPISSLQPIMSPLVVDVLTAKQRLWKLLKVNAGSDRHHSLEKTLMA